MSHRPGELDEKAAHDGGLTRLGVGEGLRAHFPEKSTGWGRGLCLDKSPPSVISEPGKAWA